MTRVSIRDIARAAGVSASTVSRALNDSPAIRLEVRSRIQGIADEMGYTPNALAQGLLSQRTHSIGLVITTISDPFFVDIVKGIDEVAQNAGISVFLATSDNDPEREIKIIEMFNRHRVDGVIVAASRISSEYASRLGQIHIPVVMINNQVEGDKYQHLNSVRVDDYAGGRLAALHLVGLGHRRIGYLGVDNRPGSNTKRMEGYQDALLETGVDFCPEWVCLSNLTANGDLSGDLQAGRKLGLELIHMRVTAVFCYCDTVAAGVLDACRKMGISVPGQLSLVGFDDNELCEIVDPPLTTIHQPKLEMGQQAMQMLLAGLNGETIGDAIVQPALVVRGSTGPPRS